VEWFVFQSVCYFSSGLDKIKCNWCVHDQVLPWTPDDGIKQEGVSYCNSRRHSCSIPLGNVLTAECLYIHVTVHRNKFLFNKTNKTYEFPKFYFVKKTLHVSGISFAHHQEFSTVHSALVYFLQVWWRLPSRVRMELVLFCYRIKPVTK